MCGVYVWCLCVLAMCANYVWHLCVLSQVRMDSRRTRNTRLVFCTTGILLRQLQGDPDLQEVGERRGFVSPVVFCPRYCLVMSCHTNSMMLCVMHDST